MFLLNRGMMQYIKHPFTRNDLANGAITWVGLYSGGPLTQTEIDYMNSAAVTQANGLLNQTNALNHLLLTRSRLADVATDAGAVSNFTTFVQKRHLNEADEATYVFSQRPEKLIGRVAGEASLAVIMQFGAATTTRSIMFASVGGPASEADIRVDDPVIVVGKWYKISDFKFKLTNLLGQ